MPVPKSVAYGIALLRVSLGILFIAHGLLKLLIFTPAGTAQYFEAIGYPGYFAYLVMVGELMGGTALVFGILTRLACLLLLPILVGATLQHIHNGWVFSGSGGGWEFPVLWIVLLIVQILLGDGAFSLGGCLFKSCRRSDS